ncbi:MAG: methyltransferase domain-containing protein [Chloroflexi bacterium]|nr:methyltransferase domain-containing protein [Chloroflexota bacterium]
MITRHTTAKTRARYNRIARAYDVAEYPIERLLFKRWRKRLWSKVPHGHGLEVGVGTGKNIPFYTGNVTVTAIDLSPKMLERAKRRADRVSINVDMAEMNVEQLEFEDDVFDWAVATFVFCSAPDPIKGFRELNRVVKPSGKIYLLEHMRIDRPVIGKLMDLYNPIVVRLTGANINRRTMDNLAASGLKLERVEDLVPLGLVKLIQARPGG